MPLEASTDNLQDELAWFIDGRYLGKWPSHHRIWWTPEPGSHELVVIDASGRSTRRTFEVRSATSGRPRTP
jgi:membrane carboxypeptidase/penicillin-binding protein PbpC